MYTRITIAIYFSMQLNTHTQQQQRIRNFLRPYILQCIIAPCINTAVGDLSAAHKKYVAVDSVME